MDRSIRPNVKAIQFEFKTGGVGESLWPLGCLNLADAANKTDSPFIQPLQVLLKSITIFTDLSRVESRRLDRSVGQTEGKLTKTELNVNIGLYYAIRS